MIARRASALALALAVAVVAVIVLGSGGSSYVVKMRLADAAGLRQGSPVAIGGQDVGTASMNVRHGVVVVSMKIDKADAPIGRNAAASVAAVNLLGQKRIELTKGNVSDPAPSGYVLPGSRISISTDLDQVLDVLTPNVRARLAILINEAGQAFAGRRADFSQMLYQLPADLQAGRQLVEGVSADNHTLGDLVQTSDGFVSQLAAQRTQLNRTIEAFGRASTTVAARRAQLASTLAKAPGTLATLRTFLAKLQGTTIPLGPAARDVAATAPALSATLAQLDPFRRAADPTLREATAVAPELTRLAAGATPVVARAVPVVSSLASFSLALQPVSEAVNHSVDNLVAILQNWSRAIQFRDGLSHVFRGEATMTPQVLTSMVNQLQAAGAIPALRRAAAAVTASRASHDAAARSGRRPSRTSAAANPAPHSSRPAGGGARQRPSTPAAAGNAASPPAGTGTGTGNSSGAIGALLNFLLGR